ncbi:MAG: hypothetical protein ACRBN8_18125 [Nannocystales bacterium]
MVWTNRLVLATALFAPALLPGTAAAENGIKPRLPVMWESPVGCVEFVDRSADPVYSFSYNIPDEDPSPGEELLPDEVSDSRRHQFIALSRQGNPQSEYPHLWLSPEDVQAALDKELIADTTVGADETMETSPIWSDHFVRITPDDARRPISWESVAEPIEWDTSSANAGAYILWGYTWEPAFNIWSQRTGNVLVVHDGDPDEVGPAAVVTSGEIIVYANDAAAIEGCVAGAEGTTLTAEFAVTPQGGELDWQPTWISFAENVPVDEEAFTLDFVPGDDYATETLLIRVTATDPAGRSYEAHMTQLVIVLPGSSGGCDETGGSIIGNPGCGGDSSTGGSSASDTGTGTPQTAGTTDSGTAAEGTSGETTAPASDTGGRSGGTCTVGGRGSGLSLLLFLGLLGIRRRRRH